MQIQAKRPTPSVEIIDTPRERPPRPFQIDKLTSIPFFLVHIAAIASAIWIGATKTDLIVCVALYYIRMFGITAGFHRYFSHRAFKTSRWFQFVLAVLGGASMQKGVLWWAAHHRNHHKFSDMSEDIHSPKQDGFYWSHVGWILSNDYDHTEWDRIRDFAKYPELRWLNRWHWTPALVGGAILYAIGGIHWFVWGGLVSSVLLWHGTFFINSLAHVWGSRRYPTTDTSRNNFWLALITMGEGWHNNHHYYQSTANQGFFWWEVDFSYYILKTLSWVGVVWDLRTPPAHILAGKEPIREAVSDAVSDAISPPAPPAALPTA